MKNMFLSVLTFIWTKIVPILLAIGLGVGIFFNFWKIQMWHPAVAATLAALICGVVTFGFGKLIKIW